MIFFNPVGNLRAMSNISFHHTTNDGWIDDPMEHTLLLWMMKNDQE